ncbi:MAG: hypothetical protein M1503_13080 [Thaumarchaeota archaeon]|nr:hypothetical protein [Nitrososphaerota archaeon]
MTDQRKRQQPHESEAEMRAARPGVKRWFGDRHLSRTASMMQRITGIGLVIFFVLHVFDVGNITGGSVTWASFLSVAETPLGGVALILVLAAIGFHFMNGIRLMLGEFGLTLPKPRRPDYPYLPRFFTTTQRLLVILGVVIGIIFALFGYLFIFLGVD